MKGEILGIKSRVAHEIPRSRRSGHKVPRDERTEKKVEEAEEICIFKDNREGTRTMRKISAADCVPAACCQVIARSFGNKDAGAKGQDSISKLRGSITVERPDCVIECTRDAYLHRVSHILLSRGFCNTCAIH